MSDTGQLRPKEKIDILLKEYDTLRAQILQLFSSGVTLAAVGGAVLGVVLSKDVGRGFWWIVGAAVVVIGTFSWIIHYYIWRCGFRIKEIEVKVNQLAGEQLLEWETLWGGVSNEKKWHLLRWLRRRASRKGNEPLKRDE